MEFLERVSPPLLGVRFLALFLGLFVLGIAALLSLRGRAQGTQGTCTTAPTSCNSNCNIPMSSRMLPVLANTAKYQVCMQSSITASSNFSNLQTGISNMVNTWNQVASQNGGGPTFELQIGSTTSCQINVKLSSDATMSTTGRWDFTPSTGTPTGGTITVRESDASSMSADVSKWLFTHELGHGLGLGDASATSGCSQTDSIMRQPLDTTQNFVCAGAPCDKTAEETLYVPPSPPPDSEPDPESCVPPAYCSPIVMAVGRSADYQLGGANTGVLFDLNSDGTAGRIAWTQSGEMVGFLALDRNQNGVIDNGEELFGNFTPLGPNMTALDGFEALAWFDRPEAGGNADGWIDPGDAIWPSLRVWIDLNHDGFSQPDELFTLSDLNISAMSTAAFAEMRRDRFGNLFRLRGEFIMNGHPRVCYDVFLAGATR